MLHDALSSALAGRYRIEHEIGRGGMATVYLAEDERHHRKVAIKVLHPELSAILGPERFLKEIELTASLQHPHILPLFDSGNANGHLYYVMPYIAGESLRARLGRERHRTLYVKSHDAHGNAQFWSVPVTGGRPTSLLRLTDPLRPSLRNA